MKKKAGQARISAGINCVYRIYPKPLRQLSNTMSATVDRKDRYRIYYLDKDNKVKVQGHYWRYALMYIVFDNPEYYLLINLNTGAILNSRGDDFRLIALVAAAGDTLPICKGPDPAGRNITI